MWEWLSNILGCGKKLKEMELYKAQILEQLEDTNDLLDLARLEKANLLEGDPLEKKWNNKRPKITPTYKGRSKIPLDPRIFWDKDTTLPLLKGTNDEMAEQALVWTIRNIRYIRDGGEFWQMSFETLKQKQGDCEDGAILMANMLLNSGVPYWRIRLNAGSVQGGGHAWLTYLRESDNKWYVMDWCYWPHESLGWKKKWDDAEKYFRIWFSWNKRYIFGDLPKVNKLKRLSK